MSVTSAGGFKAGGLASGIKPDRKPDLAIVATEDAQPVSAAAVFTTNLAAAAPVQVSKAHLGATGGRAAAVVLNSGNANAATGPGGRATAIGACELVAKELGCDAESVLVCSTGLIGIPLPLAPFTTGIPELVTQLSSDHRGGGAAARAIMTTDTVQKESAAVASGIKVGGMAKGAAMLSPNMATMLAVLTTDAAAEPGELQEHLAAAMDESFHRITVDGCTSTNDTVIILASGRAGQAEPGVLRELITRVCFDLAYEMVADAEGATKVVRVEVKGAVNDDDAAMAARRIAESNLCKCSWYGKDPYWGRVISEAASAGAAFDIDKVSVAYGGIVVADGGVSVTHDTDALTSHMDKDRIDVTVDLGLGDGSWWLLANDLTHAYVDENMGTS